MPRFLAPMMSNITLWPDILVNAIPHQAVGLLSAISPRNTVLSVIGLLIVVHTELHRPSHQYLANVFVQACDIRGLDEPTVSNTWA
jgi:hypothetical protein